MRFIRFTTAVYVTLRFTVAVRYTCGCGCGCHTFIYTTWFTVGCLPGFCRLRLRLPHVYCYRVLYPHLPTVWIPVVVATHTRYVYCRYATTVTLLRSFTLLRLPFAVYRFGCVARIAPRLRSWLRCHCVAVDSPRYLYHTLPLHARLRLRLWLHTCLVVVGYRLPVCCVPVTFRCVLHTFTRLLPVVGFSTFYRTPCRVVTVTVATTLPAARLHAFTPYVCSALLIYLPHVHVAFAGYRSRLCRCGCHTTSLHTRVVHTTALYTPRCHLLRSLRLFLTFAVSSAFAVVPFG